MNVIILNTEVFFKYKSKIGIMLYTKENSEKMNFFTGHRHLKLNRDQVEKPSVEEIELAVLIDDDLRELADDNDLVEIHNDDSLEDYIEYYSSFN